jgi:hypothetical protein
MVSQISHISQISVGLFHNPIKNPIICIKRAFFGLMKLPVKSLYNEIYYCYEAGYDIYFPDEKQTWESVFVSLFGLFPRMME